jgi:hypothetical protein
MKRLLLIAGLFVLCEASCLAQGIVWNWVPNPQQYIGIWPDPIGEPLYTGPDSPIATLLPLSMTGDGTVDFYIQLIASSASAIQLLPAGSNAVLNLGPDAINLSSGVVSSLLPPGDNWWVAGNNPGPYIIGANLIAGQSDLGYFGQFINQRGYIGVEFYAADGIHYGALDMAGFTQLVVLGFLYGYGYNPVPGAPFNLSDIPPEPVPVPFEVTLTGANEVPPNKSRHFAAGTFLLEHFTAGYLLEYNIELDGSFVPTSAGIFGPANPCRNSSVLIAELVNALPVFPWQPPAPPRFYGGLINLSSNQVAELLAGQLYVNFKSARFRQGEVRGQIWPDIPIQFTATLTGRGESPHKPRAKHDETTYGEAVFTLAGANLDGNVALNTNISWNSMGIYAPNNDVREMLAVPLTNVVGVIIPAGGFLGHPDWPGLPGQVLYPESAALTDRQVVALKNGQLFLQVRFRNGSIGGQIVPE